VIDAGGGSSGSNKGDMGSVLVAMLSPHKLVVNHKKNGEKEKVKMRSLREMGEGKGWGKKAEEDGRRQKKWRRQSKMREGKGRWIIAKEDERKAQQA
jgi:hypothetical protein